MLEKGVDSKCNLHLVDDQWNFQYAVLMEVKKPIHSAYKNKINISLRSQKHQEWPNQQFGEFFKKEKVLANSAKPKALEDHRRRQK